MRCLNRPRGALHANALTMHMNSSIRCDDRGRLIVTRGAYIALTVSFVETQSHFTCLSISRHGDRLSLPNTTWKPEIERKSSRSDQERKVAP